MSERTTIAPAITRVHKLFRIRTIVNESTNYLKPGEQGVDTEQIGRILVDRRLSRKSILDSENKLKRARDHALNASILGFFTPVPIDHQFVYVKSPIAKFLARYEFDQSCPNDLHETAIFIDRMMKLKLTNAYDSRHTYSEFRTRPLLSILTVLENPKLHISQIHYLLGQTKDLASELKLKRQLLDTFAEYPSHDERSVDRFKRDFRLGDEKTTQEIGRSTKPLLDWAQQGGLLTLTKDNWCTITENGSEVQKYYSKYIPIWYDSLPGNSELSAALLILYTWSLMRSQRISRKELGRDAREALEALQSRFGVFDTSFSHLNRPLDFDLNYDVPYEKRNDIRTHLTSLAESLQWQRMDVNEISAFTVSEIEGILKGTPSEQSLTKLKQGLGIEIPRRECFQTDLEWQVCIRLRVLQFPANPYQGEFEGETDLPMASENPDIVVKNAIRVLVECKSRKEWGDVVKYDKRVGGELYMYQSYAEDLKANSATFVCDVDRFDQDTFVGPFAKQGQKLNKICLISWSHLDKVQRDSGLLNKFRDAITTPESLSSDSRILC